MGQSGAQIAERCRDEFVRRNPLGDYTIPRVSVVRGRRGLAMLERTFGDTRVEDLALDFFCVSTDLVSRSAVVHRSGRLAAAIGASMCLPGILPPVLDGDRVLVDGGVLDNLPVEQMARGGEGPIVAVDVSQRFAAPGAEAPRAPGIKEVLARTLTLASADTATAARRHAALVVTPEVDDVGLLEFAALERTRAAGRAALARALTSS
jgi:predicted acylesterase/phospholipase RssA